MGNRGRRSRISKKISGFSERCASYRGVNRGAEKYFFPDFDFKIVVYGVIGVGDHEYQVHFEIGLAVRELPRFKPRSGK